MGNVLDCPGSSDCLQTNDGRHRSIIFLPLAMTSGERGVMRPAIIGMLETGAGESRPPVLIGA